MSFVSPLSTLIVAPKWLGSKLMGFRLGGIRDSRFGTSRYVDGESIALLQMSVRGSVISPGDAEYDAARAVYNAMIDKRPAVIVQCVDVADVMAAVSFAADRDLPIAVRGGSHNAAGLGTCDDGVVIDLGRMNAVHVNPNTKRVLVEGGATWGDVDHATQPFGLAVPSGIISTTGVGGLTLGGGFGYLSRKHGLTLDNLIAADMVLGRWQLRDRQRDRAPRSLLGHPRRRRQFRGGHRVRVPGP